MDVSITLAILIAIVCLAVGFVVSKLVLDSNANGVVARAKQSAQEIEIAAERTRQDAEKAAKTIRREAEVEAKDLKFRLQQEAEAEAKEQAKELKARENQVRQREESSDRRDESLDKREHQLSSLQGQLNRREQDVDVRERQLEAYLREKEEEITTTLHQIAAMSPEQARVVVLDQVKEECTQEAAAIIRDAETRAKAEADRKSREVLSVAIQRMAADYTAERTITSVDIPSDDVKGRIIGREGRNIRAFEQHTGVNLIIDDTPEAVTLSCFDPVRRETARITLENLIADGRIHPARIEEMFNKACAYVDQQVLEAGEGATFDMGIHDLHPELVKTLGRLKYRTSYGQNVLQHSLEVATLAGAMASELGLDPVSAKRAGLLHDLGKAVDHEVEGSHAVIGADLARRFGESPAIVHAIEAHHHDVDPSTVLAV